MQGNGCFQGNRHPVKVVPRYQGSQSQAQSFLYFFTLWAKIRDTGQGLSIFTFVQPWGSPSVANVAW